jgi:hypothetical protein
MKDAVIWLAISTAGLGALSVFLVVQLRAERERTRIAGVVRREHEARIKELQEIRARLQREITDLRRRLSPERTT